MTTCTHRSTRKLRGNFTDLYHTAHTSAVNTGGGYIRRIVPYRGSLADSTGNPGVEILAGQRQKNAPAWAGAFC